MSLVPLSIALPLAQDDYARRLNQALTDAYRRHAAAINGIKTGGYVAPTLQNGWVNYGGTSAPAGYSTDGAGLLLLRGTVKSGTIGQRAFTLPAELRPLYDQLFPVVSNDVFGIVKVFAADGAVVPVIGSAVYVALDGIALRIGA